MAFELNDPDRLAALAALGLGADAKARDIISAYRRLARLNHPDMALGQPNPEHSFADISDAYHFLTRGARNRPMESPTGATDPHQAGNPDAAGAQPPHAQPPDAAQRPDAQPGPRAARTYPPAGWADAEPMFEAGPVIIRPLPPESR